jgi:hypothetical protein
MSDDCEPELKRRLMQVIESMERAKLREIQKEILPRARRAFVRSGRADRMPAVLQIAPPPRFSKRKKLVAKDLTALVAQTQEQAERTRTIAEIARIEKRIKDLDGYAYAAEKKPGH